VRDFDKRRRVVVTGYGCVSALGVGVGPFWEALVAGRPGFRTIAPPFAPEGTERYVAWAGEYKPEEHFTDSELRLLDRNAQFAMVAAREAVAHAGITLDRERGRRVAVAIGTTIGGLTTTEDTHYRLYAERKDRAHPFTIPRLINNAAASQVAIAFGATGPVMSVSTACSSGNNAVGEAVWMIRTGRVDTALAGGTEACITWSCIRSWEALRVVARDTCRPFSAGRSGLIMGEGAGVVVLEEREAALARGATILAEIVGYGASADAADMVHPAEDTVAAAMTQALEEGGVAPEEIDYVSAHGSGTQVNDATETAAIKRVFGAHAKRMPISSTKSMHGHALGASAALELVATLRAMQEGVVPPTANYQEPDPACDLDYVPNKARRLEVRTAISNSFAFGGLNAVLCLRR
jgi:nodulation protein E